METTQPNILNSGFSSSSFIFHSWNKKWNAPQHPSRKHAVKNSAPKPVSRMKLQSQNCVSQRFSFRNGLKYPFELQWASEPHVYLLRHLFLTSSFSPALAAAYFLPLIPASVTFQCPINPCFSPLCGFLKDRSPKKQHANPISKIFGFISFLTRPPSLYVQTSFLLVSFFLQCAMDLWLSRHTGDWSPAVTLAGWPGCTASQSQPALDFTTAAAPQTPSERLAGSTAWVALRQLLCQLPSKSLDWWNVNGWWFPSLTAEEKGWTRLSPVSTLMSWIFTPCFRSFPGAVAALLKKGGEERRSGRTGRESLEVLAEQWLKVHTKPLALYRIIWVCFKNFILSSQANLCNKKAVKQWWLL